MSQSTKIFLRKLDITCLYSIIFQELYLENFSKSCLEIRLACNGNIFRDKGISLLRSLFSQNIVFVPGKLSGASRNIYVFAPHQFHNFFQQFSGSGRSRSLEHTRIDSKIQCL